MEAFVDADRVPVTPEDFFLEFVRGFVSILRAHGAELAPLGAPIEVRPPCTPEQLQLYGCELARMRALDLPGMRELLRPCADPLVESEESGGHAGWRARLATLGASPLDGEEPSVFGATAAALAGMTIPGRPFQCVFTGLALDWERLFQGLAFGYGPESEARELAATVEWRPEWLTLSHKVDLNDHLWPWVDRSLLLLCAVVQHTRGGAEGVAFMTRPQLLAGELMFGGALAQLTPANTQELDFGGDWVGAIADFPQFSRRLAISLTE